MQKKEVKKMRVLYAYRPEHEWELSLFINDVVEVIEEFADESDHTYDGWWSGKVNGKIGLFPVSYCEELKVASIIIAALNAARSRVLSSPRVRPAIQSSSCR